MYSSSPGTAGSSYTPCARKEAMSWVDSLDNFYVFGGTTTLYPPLGFFEAVTFNDFWKWNGSNWTWIGGSSSANSAGITGRNGLAASTNLRDSLAVSPRFRLHFSKKNIGVEEKVEANFYSYKDEGGAIHLVFSQYQDHTDIQVYDAQARLIQKEQISGHHHWLDAIAKPRLYVLKIENSDGVFSHIILC